MEISQLAGLSHDFSFEEERRLNKIIPFLVEEGRTIVDKGVVKKNPHTFKEVPSVTSYFLTSFRVISSNSLKHFMMIEASSLFSNFDIRQISPFPDNLVIIFVVADRY